MASLGCLGEGPAPRPPTSPGYQRPAGTVSAAKEVICVKKLLIAAIMATSAMLALALSVSAGPVPPCC